MKTWFNTSFTKNESNGKFLVKWVRSAFLPVILAILYPVELLNTSKLTAGKFTKFAKGRSLKGRIIC